MQITRPVRQRGSSGPGLLLPIGTPTSDPGGVVRCTGVGFARREVPDVSVVGGVMMFGCAAADLPVIVVVVAVDDGTAAEVRAGAGAGDDVPAAGAALVCGVDGALNAADAASFVLVATPAAAFSADGCAAAAPPHPVIPTATAPAAMINAPVFPAPDVLMPFQTC
jgi:hypothetical protein